MDGETEKDGNGWDRYSKLVLTELRHHNDTIEKLRDDVSKFQTQISTELARLQVKSGVWGMMGGLIPVIVALGIYVIHTAGGAVAAGVK